MKIYFVILLSVVLTVQPVFAGLTSDDPKTEDALKANVVDFRDWLMKELAQFPKVDTPKTGFGPRSYAYLSRKKSGFTAKQYNQAAKSDWVKSQIMQGLSVLSQQLSNTVGTAFAPQSSTQLQQYSVQLQQSSDPQFQQIGAIYNQESQAIQTGNVQAAAQSASQVAAVQQPYVAPSYQPTSSENTLAQTFNQVIGTIIASLAGILGTLAVAAILKTLGIPSLASLLGTGQVLGSTVATGQMSGTSVVGGQSPGTALTTAGNSTIQTGGSAVLQQLGTVNVKTLQSQGSSNAGSAPPAQ